MRMNIIDNSKEALDELKEKIEKGLIAVGMEAEGHAKDPPIPVDTGRLRGSITFATTTFHSSGESPATSKDTSAHGNVKENSVVIGTNVEYAPYIEFGTSKRQPVHYLSRIQNYVNDYKEIIQAALKA